MDLDCRTVQCHGFDFDAHNLLLLQLGEYPIQDATLRPAIHPRVDRMPITEPLGQTAPFAALLRHIEDRVQYSEIGQTYVATLHRQTVLDQVILRFGDFHPHSIS
jgi:hypothetical protein